MSVFLGVDVGSISVVLAAVGDEAERKAFERVAAEGGPFSLVGARGTGPPALVSPYTRVRGEPLPSTMRLLRAFSEVVPLERVRGLCFTGSGGKLLGDIFGADYVNEFKAIAAGVGAWYPGVKTIFEMGGVNSKFIRLGRFENVRSARIVDYETSGDCAAGTGAFMDQQASRLRYPIEEVGAVVMSASRAAKIAGRCSVFAKSDMIHAQQKGYEPPQVLKGLCEAVALNFKGTITKGKAVETPVAFVGGVAANAGVVQAIRDAFGLAEADLLVPPEYACFAALGAAFLTMEENEERSWTHLATMAHREATVAKEFPVTEPLSLDRVILLRNRARPYRLDESRAPIDVYLGVDVGSVSTNLALIDEAGDVVKEVYLRTDARPIQAVGCGLAEIREELGEFVRVRGVGTTGSGREMIGELIGADTVNDEITAHKTGASYIGDRLLGTRVDTIFEVGGQDSKFISLEDEVVVDFTMNEACAAGTGSFLEERAEELGIDIKGEFARVALGAERPIRLGERCTVFMEQDVSSYLQRGAAKEDLVAGLAYSVALNYINRVVRGRKIGDVIFFQGGTAYNDSVAAAFSRILDKEIIVPPYNGVMGAVGAALLAKEKMAATGGETKFRGYDPEAVDYEIKEFTCRSCTNYCDVQIFRVEGSKTFWGDKCSDKFRKRAKVEKEPVIADLLALREELLWGADGEGDGRGPSIGIPRAMYVYEQFPFWSTFFRDVGLRVVLSDETNKHIIARGLDVAVAEPCFPIQVAHGHVADLLEKGVDYVFVPNVLNTEPRYPAIQSHVCPWGQTLPWVLRAAPAFEKDAERLLTPTIQFRYGKEEVGRALVALGRKFGVPRRRTLAALEAACEAQARFSSALVAQGREALELLRETGQQGIVLFGRPYNIHDGGLNLEVASKLRRYYGVNVIPMDLLPAEQEDILDINDNMYWSYGCRILSAAKLLRSYPNLHVVYVGNFKCGPDSFIKHYVTKALGSPFLSLQFDGHSNDAGVMTRCEAYLDSKGFLRWWKQSARSPAA